MTNKIIEDVFNQACDNFETLHSETKTQAAGFDISHIPQLIRDRYPGAHYSAEDYFTRGALYGFENGNSHSSAEIEQLKRNNDLMNKNIFFLNSEIERLEGENEEMKLEISHAKEWAVTFQGLKKEVETERDQLRTGIERVEAELKGHGIINRVALECIVRKALGGRGGE